MALNLEDLKWAIVEDRPSGMHVSPNPYWITATHIPTMASVRVYAGTRRSQHKVREMALLLLEMAVEDAGCNCQYPERLEAK